MDEENDLKWWTECNISDYGKYIILVCYIVMVFIGITGNTLSIVLLAGSRGRKILSDAYRVYIIALAICDSGLLIISGLLRYTIIPWFHRSINQSNWYELYVCKWHRFLMHFFHNAAVWLLVVTTVDRFLAVCFPLVYRSYNHNSTHAKKVTTTALGLSAVFAAPFLMVGPIEEPNDDVMLPAVLPGHYFHSNTSADGSGNDSIYQYYVSNNGTIIFNIQATVQTNRKRIVGCSMLSTLPESTAYPINLVLHVSFAILVPYFVLIGLNVAILYRIHFASSLVSSLGRKQRLGRRITVMMVTVCLVFIVLWLPQVIMLFLHSDAHTNPCENNVYYSSAATISALSNSAMNFFLYCMTMKKFRKSAQDLITCRTVLGRRDSIDINGSRRSIITDTIRHFWTRKSAGKEHTSVVEGEKLSDTGNSQIDIKLIAKDMNVMQSKYKHILYDKEDNSLL